MKDYTDVLNCAARKGNDPELLRSLHTQLLQTEQILHHLDVLPPDQEASNDLEAAYQAIREHPQIQSTSPLQEITDLAIRLAESPLLPMQRTLLSHIQDQLTASVQYLLLHLNGIPVAPMIRDSLNANHKSLQGYISGQHPLPTASEPLSLLIADDEELIREYLQELLQEEDLDITTASNGMEAIAQLDHSLFDIVLTDINMPGLDGIEVLKHAKRLNSDTEVVIITGFATVENAADAVRHGAYDYLTKPFENPDHIIHLIRRLRSAVHLRKENQQLLLRLRLRNEALVRHMDVLTTALATVEEKQTALIQSDRLATLGTMAAGIAHEINNPTTFIRGNLQTLKKFWKLLEPCLNHLEEECPQFALMRQEFPALIRDMLQGTDRTCQIVHGLQTYAHPENAAEPQVPTDLSECLDRVLRMTQAEAPAGLTIKRNIQPLAVLPLLAIHQIEQVLTNIIANAFQAMHHRPSPTLNVSLHDKGQKIELIIEDNGGGMDESTLEKVFAPFFTTKPVGQGTGLGLNIAQGILHQHHAEIDIQSELHQGTRVTLQFPIPPRDNSHSQAPIKPMVLIVDDEKDIRDLLCTRLEKAGTFLTKTAANGIDALLAIKQECPAAVVLDIRMPDLGGQDLLRQIRLLPNCATLPVFAFTGLTTQRIADELRAAKVTQIFYKPEIAPVIEALDRLVKIPTSPFHEPRSQP